MAICAKSTEITRVHIAAAALLPPEPVGFVHQIVRVEPQRSRLEPQVPVHPSVADDEALKVWLKSSTLNY